VIEERNPGAGLAASRAIKREINRYRSLASLALDRSGAVRRSGNRRLYRPSGLATIL
jgi:hypothetical protein